MNQIDDNKLKELCQKHALKLLVLHGSQVKGNTTVNSDIDVGILGQNKIGYKEYSAILNDFGGLFGDKFDPAFLNNAEPMICYHVALSGRPLYEQKKGDFLNFKVQAIGRYQDTKKFRDLEKQYIKRAVGRG
jgi:predicted nucleotidyltransferase